jgi:glycosyltransferase involved in cell wall biosynthesis
MGGPAHQVSLLSGRQFHPDRYETLLVGGSVPDDVASAEFLAERHGATTRSLPALGPSISPRRDLAALAEIRRTLHRFRPHILHTHTSKAGFIGRAAALTMPRSSRPLIVHTFHGHVLDGYFGPLKQAAFRSAERMLAQRSDRLIGVSDATVSELLGHGVGSSEQFKVLRLGLDLARLSAIDADERTRARAAAGVEPDDVVCTFVGRFAEIKRLDWLLGAFADAHRVDPRLRLWLIGDGFERPHHEQRAAELGLGDHVRFLGYLGDLVEPLAASDIAVLGSANEGTPVALIEAAAAGVPAVATDVGGGGEVVVDGQTGTHVPRDDPARFALELVALAREHSRRRRMGEQARAHVIERFGADRLIADVDELYTEMLGRRSVSAPAR